MNYKWSLVSHIMPWGAEKWLLCIASVGTSTLKGRILQHKVSFSKILNFFQTLEPLTIQKKPNKKTHGKYFTYSVEAGLRMGSRNVQGYVMPGLKVPDFFFKFYYTGRHLNPPLPTLLYWIYYWINLFDRSLQLNGFNPNLKAVHL